MLLVDNILAFPVTSILWIFREIGNAAEQELTSEAENLTVQLSDLYMMLEAGQITEEEFDAQETEILDRMDAIAEQGGLLGEEEEEEEDEEEEYGEYEEEEEEEQEQEQDEEEEEDEEEDEEPVREEGQPI